MLATIAILGGVLYLAYWIKGMVRKRAIRIQLAKQECERMGHIIIRVHAFDDPRWPIDRCTRCPYQHSVRFQCPHCGEEIKPHGTRTDA